MRFVLVSSEEIAEDSVPSGSPSKRDGGFGENGVARVPASLTEVCERDKLNLTWDEVWLRHVLEIALA